MLFYERVIYFTDVKVLRLVREGKSPHSQHVCWYVCITVTLLWLESFVVFMLGVPSAFMSLHTTGTTQRLKEYFTPEWKFSHCASKSIFKKTKPHAVIQSEPPMHRKKMFIAAQAFIFPPAIKRSWTLRANQ